MTYEKTLKNSGLGDDAYLSAIVYTKSIKRRYRNLYLTILEQAKYPDLDILQKMCLQEIASLKCDMARVANSDDMNSASITTKLEPMRKQLFNMISSYQNHSMKKKPTTNTDSDPFAELWQEEEEN